MLENTWKQIQIFQYGDFVLLAISKNTSLKPRLLYVYITNYYYYY